MNQQEGSIGEGMTIVDAVRPSVLRRPVCIRMMTGDKPPGGDAQAVFRLDFLVRTADDFLVQRYVDLPAERPFPTPERMSDSLWLHEPNGIRAVSVLVDQIGLITRLRALADELERYL